MKVKHLWLYVIWRALRGLFIVVTTPVWVPLGLVVWALLWSYVTVEEWYLQVKRDWVYEGNGK